MIFLLLFIHNLQTEEEDWNKIQFAIHFSARVFQDEDRNGGVKFLLLFIFHQHLQEMI